MKVRFKLDSGRVGSVDVANTEELQRKLEEIQQKTGQGVSLENSVGMGQSLQRGAGQGITFGFADEVAGLLKGLPGSDRYEQARDEARLKNYIAEEANKKTYMLGDFGAGMLIPGGALGTTAKAANTGRKLSNLGRYAAAGGVTGAATGLGYSDREGAGALAADTALGGTAGAVLGGATGKLAEHASSLLGRVGRGLHSASVDDPQRAAADYVRSVLPDHIDTPRAARLAMEEAGPDSRLLNIDEGMIHATNTARQGGGPAASRTVSENLTPQRDAAVSRLTADVQRALPDVERTPVDMQRRWKNNPVAAENYARAYLDDYVPSEQIKREFASNRALQDAMADAAESMRGKPISRMTDRDLTELPDQVPVEYMHRLLRYVRGQKDKLYGSKDSARATDLDAIHRMVDADVKAQSPAFAQAQRYYRDQKAMDDAMELGMDVFKGKKMPEDLDFAMEGFSRSEEAAFRVGLMRSLLSRVGDITESGNTGNKVLNNHRVKELVAAGMKDPEKFTALVTRMRQEQSKARGANRLLNNSVTLEGKSDRTIKSDDLTVLSAIRDVFHRVMNQEMSPEAWQEAAELMTGNLSDEQLTRIFYRPIQQKMSGVPHAVGSATAIGTGGMLGRDGMEPLRGL